MNVRKFTLPQPRTAGHGGERYARAPNLEEKLVLSKDQIVSFMVTFGTRAPARVGVHTLEIR